MPPKAEDKRKFVRDQCDELQGIRLAALDRQLERKQQARDRHDRERAVKEVTLPKRGDLVHIHHKTSQPKVQFQWTGPTWLVVHTAINTCKVKSLISPTGRKGGPADTKTVNQKNIRIASPRPVDFWIGARIRRYFRSGWFLGTITAMGVDEEQRWFTVDYDDGDQQDMDMGEVWDMVSYHPRMDNQHFQETLLPEVGEAVVFAMNQHLRLGVVKEIHTQDRHPIETELWKPRKNAPSLHLARFKPSENEGQTDILKLSPVQIKLGKLKFNEEGFLDQDSQKKLAKYMGLSQRATRKEDQSKPNSSSRRSMPRSPSPRSTLKKSPEPNRGPRLVSKRTGASEKHTEGNVRRTPPSPIFTRRYQLRPRRSSVNKPP